MYFCWWGIPLSLTWLTSNPEAQSNISDTDSQWFTHKFCLQTSLCVFLICQSLEWRGLTAICFDICSTYISSVGHSAAHSYPGISEQDSSQILPPIFGPRGWKWSGLNELHCLRRWCGQTPPKNLFVFTWCAPRAPGADERPLWGANRVVSDQMGQDKTQTARKSKRRATTWQKRRQRFFMATVFVAVKWTDLRCGESDPGEHWKPFPHWSSLLPIKWGEIRYFDVFVCKTSSCRQPIKNHAVLATDNIIRSDPKTSGRKIASPCRGGYRWMGAWGGVTDLVPMILGRAVEQSNVIRSLWFRSVLLGQAFGQQMPK